LRAIQQLNDRLGRLETQQRMQATPPAPPCDTAPPAAPAPACSEWRPGRN
jgi:hypothetical protein